MVMGNSKNSCVFNFVILFKLRKSENLMLAKYTCSKVALLTQAVIMVYSHV